MEGEKTECFQKESRVQCRSMEPDTTTKTTEEQHEIVTFIEEGDVLTNNEGTPRPPSFFKQPASDGLTNSVVGFLERPIEMANFDWTIAMGSGQEILPRISLPATWLSVPMIKEKLSGFQYLRCSFKIRVQVNAQPFHAGRLLIVFEPLFDQQEYIPSNMRHLGGATGYHHVDLDVNEGTSAEITIPFVSNISHFDLVNGIGQLGTVRMFVYSALTGSTDCDGTIWVQACDVEPEMPTGMPIIPRLSGRAQSRFGSQAGVASETKPQYDTEGVVIDPGTTHTKEKKEKGVLQTVSGVVKNIATAVAVIPAISPFALGVGWIAAAAEGISSIFGWSKPLNEEHALAVLPCYARNFTTSDGLSNAKVMALASNNENVVPVDLFGTRADEMNLSHVTQLQTFVSRFNLSTGDLPNQVVWKWPVSPAACSKFEVAVLGVPTWRVSLNTMLSYVASMFGFWRGGITYVFKLVKTRFHTARVRISFIPGAQYGTPLSQIDINMAYSKIYDLREETEIEFEVPFVANQPWLSLNRIGVLEGSICETLHTGIIIFEVLNALRAPETIAPTIEILVEQRASSDLQFAYPRLDKVNLPAPFSPAFSNYHSVNDTLATKSVLRLNDTTARLMHSTEIGHKKKQALTESKPGPQVETIVAPDAKEERQDLPPTEIRICDLPISSGPVPVNIGPDQLPTHTFTVADQNIMWRDWVKIDPTRDTVANWERFLQVYPDAGASVCEFNPDYTIKVGGTVKGKAQSRNIIRSSRTTDPTPNVYGIGEIVTSFRQLLKRNVWIGDNTNPLGDIVIEPYVTGSRWATSALYDAVAWDSIYERASMIYRWKSGSLRVGMTPTKTLVNTPGTVIAQLRAGNISTDGGWILGKITTGPSDDLLSNEPLSVGFIDREKHIEYQLPFYQKTPMLPTDVGAPRYSDQDAGSFILDDVPNNAGTQLRISGLETYNFWLSTGEDFTFGYLVGPPLSVASLL